MGCISASASVPLLAINTRYLSRRSSRPMERQIAGSSSTRSTVIIWSGYWEQSWACCQRVSTGERLWRVAALLDDLPTNRDGIALTAPGRV